MRSRILVLLSALCFGTTGTAAAFAPKGSSSLAIGTARIIVGAGALLLVAAFSPRAAHKKTRARAWLLGAAGMAGYQVTFFHAVQLCGVMVGTVIALGSAPAITGVLNLVWLKKPVTRTWVIATTFAILGVGLMTVSKRSGTEVISVLGVLLALLAGLSYATFAITSKELLMAGVSFQKAMAGVFGLGALMLTPLLLIENMSWLKEIRGISVALWLGVVATTVAYLLYSAGLKNLPANEAATLTLAEPVTATIFGVTLLAEHPPLLTWVGALVVLAGLAILARSPAQTSS